MTTLTKENAQVFTNAIKAKHLEAITHLFAQLSPNIQTIDPSSISTLQQSGTVLMLSIHQNNDPEQDPIGIAFLLIAKTLWKKFGLVEDVIVDENARGLGLGSKLLDILIQAARDSELSYLQLTSKPHRTAANELYLRKGFALIAQAPAEPEGTSMHRNMYRLYL